MPVTSPRDAIDEWMSGEVTPLNPPPGSLDQIRRRARQRKTRQVILTAAGCAVVLAAGVTVPQFVLAGHQGRPSGQPVATGPTTATTQPTSPPASSASPNGSATPLGTKLTTGYSGAPAPGNFQPTSVTVVGVGPALVGAVIGQAGTPGQCTGPIKTDCTSLAGTSNYGHSWYGVSAPVTSGPNGSEGVSQLRFTNLSDGWAFGPALYETSGGGIGWHRESTNSQRVIDVEAAGTSALAIFATCTGTGVDYAADCTSFSLYSSVSGSTSWTQVTVPAGVMSTGQPSSASLVISGGRTGYLLTPSGAVLTGPVSGGTWTSAGTAPCKPGPALANGEPADAQLAAGSDLMLSCEGQPGMKSGQVEVFTSPHGARWTLAGNVTAAGTPTSLASASGQTVLATNAGIYYSGDNGRTWRAASLGGTAPPGGFTFVGMTNASQGVAVPTKVSLGLIYVTTDRGHSWSASRI